MEKLEKAVYVGWEESARGWGDDLSSGSLHLTEQDYRSFLIDYYTRKFTAALSITLRPATEPLLVSVSEELFKCIKDSKKSMGSGLLCLNKLL